MPFLKKLHEQYKGSNLAFVSISLDGEQQYAKWKSFIAKEAPAGVQLMAEKGFRSKFIEAYGINSIPRFIIIDPNGNVVDADAKRPDDPKLAEQLDALLSTK